MLEQKRRFRHESIQDKKSIQGIFKAIAKGIANGELEFSDEDGQLVMNPKGLLNVKLTASENDGNHRFDIRISWREEDKIVNTGILTVK